MSRTRKCGRLRFLLWGVAALGLGLATSARADVITFDADGTGTMAAPLAITGLNFNPGNALAVGAINPSTGNLVTTPFTVYYQTTLGSVQSATTGSAVVPTGLGTNYQVTEVATFQEQVVPGSVSPNGSTAAFQLVNPSAARLNIYFSPTVTANNSTGTGFTDGSVILSANPLSFNGGNFTDETKAGTAGTTTFNQTNFPYTPSPGATADRGSGSTSVNLSVTPGYNPAFFQPPNGTPILSTSIIASNLQSFFDAVPPSQLFTNPITSATVVPNIGSNNGTSGPDFQFQVSGLTQSFQVVPEPASVTMAATALGIVPLVAWGLRRRTKTPLA
jgi:hypothetical protein